MSALKVNQRYFENSDVIARETESTGWGLFATTACEPGDAIFWLSLVDTPFSTIVKWHDSFGECYDRGFTIVPDFAFCCISECPFWNMNHSCNPNAGFVNWSRIENNRIPIVAFRHIAVGEEVTADYATFAMSYDGTPEGDPWEMMPCLCGEANCRGTITGFEGLPLDLQLKYVLATGNTPGRVLAHIVHDLPHLETILQSKAPDEFRAYQRTLQQLQAKSTEFQGTLGPSTAPLPRRKA
jgi:SET domain